MVAKTPEIPRQELHDTEGRTFAYLVSAEEMARLLAEIDALRSQLEVARRQKDYYAGQLKETLLTFAPVPPTKAEFDHAAANPSDLSAILSDLNTK